MITIRRRGTLLLLPVRVQPGASRAAVEGEHAGKLKVVVAAPPEKGKANKALLRMLARTLGVGRGDVALAGGETSRDKLLAIEGLSFEALAETLQRTAGVTLERES